jgi:hypothetical protein
MVVEVDVRVAPVALAHRDAGGFLAERAFAQEFGRAPLGMVAVDARASPCTAIQANFSTRPALERWFF